MQHFPFSISVMTWVFMIDIQHDKCLRAVSPFINIDERQYQHA